MLLQSINTKPTLAIFIITVNVERDTIYSCLAFANLRWADGVYFFASWERVLRFPFAIAIFFPSYERLCLVSISS